MEYQIPQLVFSSCVAAGIGVYIFSQLDPNYLPDERATRWQEKLSKFGTKTATAMIHLKIISKVPDILNKLGLSKACEKIYQTIDNRLRGQELLVQAQKKEYVADITLDDPCFDYLRPILDPFYRIADFLRRPEQYSFTGLKNCQAILLIAPPGFGKSFTARAAAGLFNQAAGRTAFISINSIDLFKKARNSEAVLNSIIEDAKANAPCILWLDELHLLMGGLQIDKNSFMLDDILKALDTLNQNADPERMVFIIGATNRPDLLDKALLRPGRFSQIISLPQPTAHDRTNLLESFCKQTAIDPSVINLPYIAAITVDASPSTLKSVFEYGHFLAKREYCCLETKHLYEAVNRIVRNIQPYTPYTPEEKNEIAARIAGQVLYCSKFNQTNLIDAATISPIRKEIKEVYDWMTKIPNDAGANLFATQKGQVFFATEGNYFISQDFLESLAAQYISLEVLQIPTTSKEVIEARNYIYATLLQKYSGGISLEKLAKKHAELIKQEAFTAVQEIENKVRERLSLEKNTLSLLQNTLLERSFLPKESIMDALEQASKTR
jgi:AAA+ superfamily predicted ATPase